MVEPRIQNRRITAFSWSVTGNPLRERYVGLTPALKKTSKPWIRALRKGTAAVRIRTTAERPLRLKFITSRARFNASASSPVSFITRSYINARVAMSEAVVPVSKASQTPVANPMSPFGPLPAFFCKSA